MKRLCLIILFVVCLTPVCFASEVCDFEDRKLEDNEIYPFKNESLTEFKIKNFYFPYHFKAAPKDSSYDYWTGFVYSTGTDNSREGGTLLSKQYNAITGEGVNGSLNYCISYPDYIYDSESKPVKKNNYITLEKEAKVSGFYITNTTYAYYAMEIGYYCKKFGGETGNDPDYFKLIIEGYDDAGKKIGETEFYLADFRFEDNSKDYIVDEWKWVDLSGFGKIKKLAFEFDSSDRSVYEGTSYINTPTYFAMDNLNGTPPATDTDSKDDGSSSGSCFISSAYSGSSNSMFVLFALIAGTFFILLKRGNNED